MRRVGSSSCALVLLAVLSSSEKFGCYTVLNWYMCLFDEVCLLKVPKFLEPLRCFP